MAALLVALAVMSVLLSAALPVWRTAAKREREAELVFRGEQYARAIGLFQRKYANAFPPNLDILVDERFLRRKYKDPITKGDFQLLYMGNQAAQQPGPPAQGGTRPPQGPPGRSAVPVTGGIQAGGAQAGSVPGVVGSAGAQGGIMGVTSKSTDTSLRLYNGRNKYNEWAFVYQQANTRIAAPEGTQRPGVPGGGPPGGLRPGGGPPGGIRPGGPPQGPGSVPRGSNPSSPLTLRPRPPGA